MEASSYRASLTVKSPAKHGRVPTAVPTSPPRLSYWEGIQCDVQLYLKEAIPRGPPEAVYEPMRHLTFAAPTTTASSLCVAACELVGGDRKQAIAAAAALHLMHAALYAHEHLPLTEGHPPSRRPIEHRYGPNIELLTGDGLIPFGVELVAQSMDPSSNNHDRILKVIIEITRATGSQGMVDGLYRRKNLELHSDSDITELEYVCKKIEGEIHACGGACGAILGGAGEEEIERLRKFGLLVGTIRGFVSEKYESVEEKIEEAKALALKEIEGFSNDKAELISGLVNHPSAAVAIS